MLFPTFCFELKLICVSCRFWVFVSGDPHVSLHLCGGHSLLAAPNTSHSQAPTGESQRDLLRQGWEPETYCMGNTQQNSDTIISLFQTDRVSQYVPLVPSLNLERRCTLDRYFCLFDSTSVQPCTALKNGLSVQPWKTVMCSMEISSPPRWQHWR